MTHDPVLPADPSDTSEPAEVALAARCNSAVEANLLRGVLESAGIAATVTNDHLSQAAAWMGGNGGVGGVRVWVPAAQHEDALRAVADYEKGALILEGETVEPGPVPTQLALWGPDAAAFWSFALTPVFGAVLHGMNSRVLGESKLKSLALRGLVMSLTATAVIAWWAVSHGLNARTLWETGVFVNAATVAWYFLFAQPQSKFIARSFGSHFKRRPLTAIAVPLSGLAYMALQTLFQPA
ncbi:MAG: hypothetical protein RLZZ618_2896 [Pseudomonadota bacterium]|jgi:hypothetical protein